MAILLNLTANAIISRFTRFPLLSCCSISQGVNHHITAAYFNAIANLLCGTTGSIRSFFSIFASFTIIAFFTLGTVIALQRIPFAFGTVVNSSGIRYKNHFTGVFFGTFIKFFPSIKLLNSDLLYFCNLSDIITTGRERHSNNRQGCCRNFLQTNVFIHMKNPMSIPKKKT